MAFKESFKELQKNCPWLEYGYCGAVKLRCREENCAPLHFIKNNQTSKQSLPDQKNPDPLCPQCGNSDEMYIDEGYLNCRSCGFERLGK